VLGAPIQSQRSHHLHLQADQLVAAALQHGGGGCDHPDGGHGPAGFLQQKVLSGRSYTTVAGKAYAAQTSISAAGAGSLSGLGIVYLLVSWCCRRSR